MATKILTVGSALGAYTSLFTKVKAIDAKHGKFEVLLCVGDFFPPSGADETELDSLLDGKLEVPFSTYVMQGVHSIPSKVLEHASKHNGELCTNVYLLDKTGIITTSHKLTIASFGGKYDAESFGAGVVPLTAAAATFNEHNLSSFLSSSSLPTPPPDASHPSEPSLASIKSSTSTSQIDILLTNEWPSHITRLSKTVPADASQASSSFLVPPLDDIVKASRPRYHFASSGGDPPVFWEREPYVWDGDLVSRFVSLGSFGAAQDPSAKKQRWFYAFSIAPLTSNSPPVARPANATASPFPTHTRGSKRLADADDNGGNFIFGNVQTKKPRLADQKHAYNQHSAGDKATEKPHEGYVCRICKSTEHYIKDCPEKNATGDTGGKKPPKGYVCRACGSEGHLIQDCPTSRDRQSRAPRGAPKEIGPDECWFCLSNPRVTKHLIVSIGTEVYVTLPKGQLPPSDPSVSGPTSVPGGGHCLLIPVSHYPTFGAIPAALSSSVLSELDTYKAALGKMYAQHGAVPVFFEISRNTGRGAGGHAHVQVVPVPEARKAEVEGAFKAYGGMQITWEADPIEALSEAVTSGSNYFRVDLPDGRKMVHVMKQGRPFNLQFGREALAHFLELGDRADWKACSQTEEEEIRDAQAFKEAFAEFDPSML